MNCIYENSTMSEETRDNFRLSLVVPIYNEEQCLPGFLDNALAFRKEFEANGDELEIILVNDGSTDDSAGLLEKFVQQHPDGFVFISSMANHGYGATLKKGFRAATHPVIGIIDADGTYKLEQIPSMVNVMKENPSCAMVVGNRHQKGNKIPLLRRPPKWVLRKQAEFLVSRRIPDLNSGMRLMDREILMRYIHLLPDRFSLTTTVTLAFMSDKHDVEYVPIDYERRTGKSSIRPIHDVLAFFQLIIRTVLYFNPLRVFMPLGLLLVFASAAVLILSYLFTPKVMDITTIVLFLAGVHLMSLGMLADLIVKRFQNSG
jgi:glycosyltransferase involved in cell wall biosynthesis